MTNPAYDTLTQTVGRYRAAAAENYARIRALAEALEAGFCSYLGAGKDSPCVLLIPPGGAFEPKSYGDKAFSIPPSGFQPLGPVSFGLGVKVSEGDWLRVTLTCMKEGPDFTVRIHEGGQYVFKLPLHAQDPGPFFEMLHAHIVTWFARAVDDYDVGNDADRTIGFDFFRADDE